MIEYRTIDKSGWKDGPWKDEPDKIQWTDETTGLPCLIKRVSHHGALCGYVGVSKGHPYYGMDDMEVPGISVHGGLTYADKCQEGPEASTICHIPEPGQPDDVWWLGFDCAHSGDLMPARGSYGFYGDAHDVYRDVDYVRQECKQLAEQLMTV